MLFSYVAMDAVRAFIAINFSPEIQERLEYVSGQLKSRLEDVPVRWVPVGNIHLTLKFLGDVSTSNLDMLYGIIRSEAEKYAQFEFSVGELGAYPSIHRPRVIWVGVEAPPELTGLQKGIEHETARLGYAREKRPFSPHLTIGRVSRNASSNHVHTIANILGDCKVGFLGATRVNAVYLYRSDLQPQGAVYTQLYCAELMKENDWVVDSANFIERWNLDTLEIARNVVNVLEEKKGEDILLIEIIDISDFADYFVICTGTSNRMLNMLSDDVMKHFKSTDTIQPRLEGESEDGWLLIDFGEVIVHLFSPDRRAYYRLEELWGEGKVLLHLH